MLHSECNTIYSVSAENKLQQVGELYTYFLLTSCKGKKVKERIFLPLHEVNKNYGTSLVNGITLCYLPPDSYGCIICCIYCRVLYYINNGN